MMKNERLQLLVKYMGKCFSASPSPFMRWLKPIVRKAELGNLEFEYEIREEWLNPIGNLHGGITAAIIDDIIGATMFSLNEPFFHSTINNSIDYFSIAKRGDKIIAETQIIKRGKQFINAECRIWNYDKSKMIAKGTSNLFKTEI